MKRRATCTAEATEFRRYDYQHCIISWEQTMACAVKLYRTAFIPAALAFYIGHATMRVDSRVAPDSTHVTKWNAYRLF